jgi:hypothetical protein
VWRNFKVPKGSSKILSLGKQLLVTGNVEPSDLSPEEEGFCGTYLLSVRKLIKVSPKICAYSSFTQTWVQVGDIPYSYQHSIFNGCSTDLERTSLLSLLSGELLLVLTQSNGQEKVLKASLKSKCCIFFIFNALSCPAYFPSILHWMA